MLREARLTGLYGSADLRFIGNKQMEGFLLRRIELRPC
jgi:hypothetical protein